jgi:O-antigen/teichoic acid export membrane protein
MTTLQQTAVSEPVEGEARQDSAVRRLTSGSLLARNATWNLIGQFAPMAVAIAVIPKLIRGLGTDRFGALTIAWMVVGYFSLFDLGLGRALTNLVAQKLGADEQQDLAPLIWTANILMLALGIIGLAAFAMASPVIVHRVLKVPPSLQPEIIRSFLVLSLSIPFVISTAGFRGILEAKQEFKLINAVRVPLGVVTFIVPLLVLPFSTSLVPVVALLTVTRAVFCGLYFGFAIRSVPALRHGFEFDRSLMCKLLGFGGWMTVSNILSPIMMYSDRFLIGGLLSLTAVTYYATPYEVATKLSLIPAAVVGVLFPAFSTALVSDPNQVSKLFHRAVKYVAVALFPIVFLMMMFAREGLSLWLGAKFATHSTAVLQWIALGMFINALAFIPFALIQGAGRADITGKLHMVELPLYLLAVWFLTRHLGITGAAIAGCGRLAADCGCLFWLGYRFTATRPMTNIKWGTLLVVAPGLLMTAFITTLLLKLAASCVILFTFVILVWKYSLTLSERLFIQSRFWFLLRLGA